MFIIRLKIINCRSFLNLSERPAVLLDYSFSERMCFADWDYSVNSGLLDGRRPPDSHTKRETPDKAAEILNTYEVTI